MTKYKETTQKMLTENNILFSEFKNIHDRYGLHMDLMQDQFNEVGKKVMKVIRDYENKLCNRSEGNGYAAYSGNLAQKFMDEIRGLFPYIDRVGLIVKKSPIKPVFTLSKIDPAGKVTDFSLKKLL